MMTRSVAFAPQVADRDSKTQIVAGRLMLARRRSGLSVAAVAEQVGKSRNTIADWESGRTSPTAVDLSELLRIYGCSGDWLLGADGESGFAALIDRRCEQFLLSTDSLDDFLARFPSAMIVLHEELSIERDPTKYAQRIRKLLDREDELRAKARTKKSPP